MEGGCLTRACPTEEDLCATKRRLIALSLSIPVVKSGLQSSNRPPNLANLRQWQLGRYVTDSLHQGLNGQSGFVMEHYSGLRCTCRLRSRVTPLRNQGNQKHTCLPCRGIFGG
jgi:hypothetical protein